MRNLFLICLFVLSCSSILGQDGGFVVTEKPVVQTVESENNMPYFVMFTSFGCDPCNRMKATEVPKLEKAGYSVTIIDINANDTWNRSWGITNVPRTFLIDRKTRKRIYGPWISFNRAEKLIEVANNYYRVKPVKSKNVSLKDWINSNYDRGTPLTWSVSGKSVYDHLQDGSDGTHVFTYEQIKDLSEWEALALHQAIHTGKFKP